MPTAVSEAVYVGTVRKILPDRIAVELAEGFLAAAQAERRAQLGTFVVIQSGDHRLIGMILAILGEGEEPPAGRMDVQLFAQIVDGRFQRGVGEYPLITDPVFLPTPEDLDIVLGSPQAGLAESGGRFALDLGRCALNDAYPVLLDGEHFFSKHAAVLGNSGAGKSCAVARIVSEAIRAPHAQIILFDLHGEYRTAFSDDQGRLFDNVTYLGERDLVVPYWLLRFSEFDRLFVQRSDPEVVANQQSFLRDALIKLKRPTAWALDMLEGYTVDTPLYFSLENLATYAVNMNQARFVLGTKRYAFAKNAQRNLAPAEQEKVLLSQPAEFNQGNAEGEIPHAIYYHKLNGLINRLSQKYNDHRYNFLLQPIPQARRSKLFTSLFPQIEEERQNWTEMTEWVIRLILGRIQPRRNLTIVDLSAIPFDFIDLTVGLLTRIVFEFNFYCRPEDRQPVLFIFEEAHNYIGRDDGRTDGFARLAVEQVAKEGRKYGISALVVSQRPNELSATVLSQCNNLIALRINNPDDQHFVAKVVSDQFAGLVSALPILRPGEAFVVGDSVPLPMRTLISLPPRLPSSRNVDFMKVWSDPAAGAKISQTLKRWLRQDRTEP